MAGGLVILHPLADVELGNAKPHALADENGRFKIYTYRTDDGAPAGEYAVTVLPKKPKREPGTAKSKGAKRQVKGGSAKSADPAMEKPATKKAKSDRTPQSARHQRKKEELEASFPHRYSDPKTSGIRIEVKEGVNELDPFQLAR
jgi:hypothetical protein